MIQIDDNDLPITVAEKLITATKKCEDGIGKAVNKMLGGDGKQDMFSVDELYEISMYLGIFARKYMEADKEET